MSNDDRRPPVPRTETYPTQCPSCRQQAGVPKSASTVPGEPFLVRLLLNCGSCAHAWTVDKLTAKPDP
jgi:hypothetical protein